MASSRSVRRAQEPVTYTCALCDSEDGVRWYCNDCRENLCDRCKEIHTRGNKTKNDDVVSIGEANRHEAKPVPEVCKLHPGKLCDLYCSDCNLLLCSMCLSKLHKQHNLKPFEDEFSIRKQHLNEHMAAISAKIEHFKSETSERHHVTEAFNDNIDTMRKDVNIQRTKLKKEVDSIADAVLAELSSMEKTELETQKEDCQLYEKNVAELTSLLEKAEITNTSSVSMFEIESSLRTSLSRYDVNVKSVLPKQPNFVTGSIDRAMLAEMLGELHHKNQYEKTDIDSKHVQHLSKCSVLGTEIFNICPVDDSHAWLTPYLSNDLVLVNREGVVKERVNLDFSPHRITMAGTANILMTSSNDGSFVYKLSLHNKNVTTFADIKPYTAWDISINERDEVFVSTDTPDIVVLNQSGTIVRKVPCCFNGGYIACLSSGNVAVITIYKNALSIADESGTVQHTWKGEINKGQKVGQMRLGKISRDKYNRLFVPDFNNNQVYVLPRDGTQATCLLDQRHRVVEPTAVGVDTCGNVWIGCGDGTVHVMRL